MLALLWQCQSSSVGGTVRRQKMQVSTNFVTRRTFFTTGGLGALAVFSAGQLAAAQEFKSVSPEVEKSNIDRKSTRLNSSHIQKSRMPSSA